jgi:dihydrolipoamide dehydrogenase
VSVADEQYEADSILVATGSRPGDDGLQAVDSSRIMQIGELFDAEELSEKYLVYGSSPYACETAFMLRLIGRQVALVSPENKLMQFLDHDLSNFVADRLSKCGVQLHPAAEVSREAVGGVLVGGGFVECDKVINCSDRIPVLPTMDIDMALHKKFISISENMETSASSIYAAGDVTGQITAHIGSAQGVAAVNHIAGIGEKLDYRKLPINIYLSPEIASVGLSETELETMGREYSKGVFPLSANGKAMAEGNTEGFVKVLAEKKYGEVLGVHIVAPHATDMIAEAIAIMELEGTLEDVGRIVHAHPTVSESIVEASLAAAGMPRHI